jgi:hypothetical protein
MEYPIVGSVPIANPGENVRWIQILDGSFRLTILGPLFDEALSLFYEAAGSRANPDKRFSEMALKAFDSNQSVADEFFNNITPLWNYYLNKGDLIAASKLWEEAIKPAFQWQDSRNGHLHKGSAFYFAGVTAILARDFDRGYLFLHKALEDDIKATNTKSPGTPAYRAVVIDPDLETQLFREWVRLKADVIKGGLEKYRQKHQKALDFEGFKARFLVNEKLRETVFLFSHSIARFINLSVTSRETLSSDFGRNLCLNLLFDLALVIDLVIPEPITVPQKHRWKFISKAASLGVISGDHLGLIGERFKAPGLFGQTVEELLDEKFNYQGCQPKGLSAAVAISYGCRNRGAHHVESATVVAQRFPEMFQELMETLFLAVETFP